MHNQLPYEIAVAGLLHDIGKVLHPAKIPLSKEAQNLEQMICPVYEGRYSHQHVLYTAHVLYGIESDYGKLDRSRIEKVAIYHHRPNNNQLDENILTKADWLASGHDRQSTEKEEERTGLVPIVSTLSLAQEKDRQPVSTDFISPTSLLDFSEDKFLPQEKQSRVEYSRQCALLSEQIQNELNRDYSTPEHCVESVLGIVQRTMHAIPASRYRGHVPDVSLFDHSRMVAAVGTCLAKLNHKQGYNANEIKGQFRFITLGVGGIQNFIFRTVLPLEPNDNEAESEGKGNAKRLRARSFYISLYSWIAARKVLNEIGLPMTNLVFDAGGHALLLVPDTSEVIQTIEQTLKNIANDIRIELGGTLRFDYEISKPLLESDFHSSQFPQVFQNIELARANARLRFPDDSLWSSTGWTEKGWINQDSVSLVIDREPFLKRLKKLGQVLPKAEYIAIESGDTAEWSEKLMGIRVSLHCKRPTSGLVYSMKLDEDIATPFFLSGSHLPVATDKDVERLENISLEEDTEESVSVGETLPFSALSHLATNDQGEPVTQPMLGILKADVDLLGALFSYGFSGKQNANDEISGERASLARLAALSRSLDQFFKGFLIEKLRTEYNKIYTVFVGGDDLFLIGPWYDIVRLARDFHQWFARMTCQNKDVTFSAGIVFSKPSTPVAHLAALAEEALEGAKLNGRNRIGYGNIILSWEQYLRAWKLHQLFLKCVASSSDSKGVTPSLMYRLLKYAQQAMRCGELTIEQTAQSKASYTDMKWRAQLNYDLRRNLPEPTPERPEILQFQKELMGIVSPKDDAPVLYTAASLTLYLLRGESE